MNKGNDGDRGSQGRPAVADAAMDGEGSSEAREQDQLMPITNITRIMRKVLPAHAKITEEAKGTVQSCVSEFIAYVTAEANERCRQEQRATVMAEDVLWALGRLSFDMYVEYLNLYLHQYRLFEGDHRPSRREVTSPAARRAAATVVGLYPAQGVNKGVQGYPTGLFPTDGGCNGASATMPTSAVAVAAAAGGGIVMMPEDCQKNVAGAKEETFHAPQQFGFIGTPGYSAGFLPGEGGSGSAGATAFAGGGGVVVQDYQRNVAGAQEGAFNGPQPFAYAGAQDYPAGFFPYGGQSSGATAAAGAAEGGIVMMTMDYQRANGGAQGGPSEEPQLFGFGHFAPYN